MKKNSVLIINPVSSNIIKAIYNAIVINLLDIIILGDRTIIYTLCKELNLDIEQLQIINLIEINDISFKIEEYIKINEIKGIIIDDNIDGNLIKKIKTKNICNLVDYGVFLKSIFIIKYQNYNVLINNIKETENIMRNLNIFNVKIGIVGNHKTEANNIKKELRKNFNYKKIDIINESKISNCKYNIIIFEDKMEEMIYLNNITNKVLVRRIEIKKASNVYIFDAKGKQFKNIFLQLLYLSKIDNLNNEINTKII